MAIWIDGDACPREVKDIVFRAGIKQQHQINFIANSYHRLPSSPWIKTYQVNKEPDAADLHIIEHIAPGDLLITSDIPLASEALKNGAKVISPRGDKFSEENIASKLATRDLMEELRQSGEVRSGPPAFSPQDKKKFADLFSAYMSTRKPKQ